MSAVDLVSIACYSFDSSCCFLLQIGPTGRFLFKTMREATEAWAALGYCSVELRIICCSIEHLKNLLILDNRSASPLFCFQHIEYTNYDTGQTYTRLGIGSFHKKFQNNLKVPCLRLRLVQMFLLQLHASDNTMFGYYLINLEIVLTIIDPGHSYFCFTIDIFN